MNVFCASGEMGLSRVSIESSVCVLLLHLLAMCEANVSNRGQVRDVGQDSSARTDPWCDSECTYCGMTASQRDVLNTKVRRFSDQTSNLGLKLWASQGTTTFSLALSFSGAGPANFSSRGQHGRILGKLQERIQDFISFLPSAEGFSGDTLRHIVAMEIDLSADITTSTPYQQHVRFLKPSPYSFCHCVIPIPSCFPPTE